MIKKAIENLIKKETGEEAVLEIPANSDFGDYATNLAIREKLNPIQLAEKFKKAGGSLFGKVEVKNGFINFYLSEEYLLEELKKIIKDGDDYGSSNFGRGKTLVIDYSAPNIAKPFGIGHLRSTIIGQAIYNLYRFLGYKCVGDNHLGDWGTQFGKLIYQIESQKSKINLPAVLRSTMQAGIQKSNSKVKNDYLKDLTVADLEKLYVEFHQKAQEDLSLQDEARLCFKKLEDGDEEAMEIWQACRDISMREFKSIYELLDVEIDYTLGESFYQDKMEAVFDEMKKKGLTRQSEGAWVVEFPSAEPPSLVLVKSDGSTTYFLRDLATVWYRLKEWRPDFIVYEVGVDQSLYLKQLFKTVAMLNWAKDVTFVHVAHGLVRGKTGKFSTRKGQTVHLEDVLKEAINRARQIIESSGTSRGFSEVERAELSKQVGIGAIKYNDLSQNHSRDIIFEWEKILNIKGNSGPYLQYTYARCQSVLEKSGGIPIADNSGFNGFEGSELKLLRMLVRFPEVVQEAAISFSPNVVCNYVFKLAQGYNLFYNSMPILQAANERKKNFRLSLTSAAAQVIKNSLTLMGIQSPKRM